MTGLIPPHFFGLPDKFQEWRPHQAEACEEILDCEERFLLQVCPTGFGKSLVYLTAAMLTEGRTVILTSTKGLQTQLVREFGDLVVSIKGKSNYPCRLNTKLTCDMGICAFGLKCSLRTEGGCLYYDQWKQACKAKIVVTNYAYWMAQNEYGEGIGDIPALLVLDEAHAAPEHVNSHVSVTLQKGGQEGRVLGMKDGLPNVCSSWKLWSQCTIGELEEEKEKAQALRKEKQFLFLKRLLEKVTRLHDNIDNTWVWDDTRDSVTLSPIWPAPYAEESLFMGAEKVVFTSATAVPKTASLLGVENMAHTEYPHSFPVEHRTLTHVPTIKMNHRITTMEERLWVTKVDNIIRDRLGTKGIIHTVSYKRRDLLLAMSRYAGHMVVHERKTTEKTVQYFKSLKAPAILVSPSMTTGWDFPDDECRWQVIIKLPFPDTRGAIIKSRADQDDDFLAYLVMQQLIQTTGRGVRSDTDWCETFIIDNNIEWFLKRNKHLTVEWFHGAYRVVKTIPKPMNGGV